MLYVFVYGKTAFFLDVLNHEFYNSELLEIINKNWPKLLKNYEMQGVSYAEIPKIKDVRNKNEFYFIKIGEKYYFPIGGGLNSYGSSITLIKRASFIENNLNKIEIDLKERGEEYKLVRNNKNLYLKISNRKINLPSDIFDNIHFFNF